MPLPKLRNKRFVISAGHSLIYTLDPEGLIRTVHVILITITVLSSGGQGGFFAPGRPFRRIIPILCRTK
jgi:hypothetical protein